MKTRHVAPFMLAALVLVVQGEPTAASERLQVRATGSWGEAEITGGVDDADEVVPRRSAVRRLDRREASRALRCGERKAARLRGRARVARDRTCEARAGGSSGIARGDFNGDGFGDLAIGVPDEDFIPKGTQTNVQNAGAVHVIYGSAHGLDAYAAPGNQLWTQGGNGLVGQPAANDRFGTSLAAGDFNGDRYSDLAIGVPGEEIGTLPRYFDAGGVQVIYGSPAGLSASAPPGNQIWSQGAVGVPGGLAGGDRFGSALAWGDFDGDGFGDLAVGVPGEDDSIEGADVGAVNVIPGSAGGLTAVDSQLWWQTGIREGHDHAGNTFGATLAAGDFNGDGDSDLAIGVPGNDYRFTFPTTVDLTDVGLVEFLHGSASGLRRSGREFALGVETLESHDRFGEVLAAGDFNGDGMSDLAVGVPHEDAGTLPNAVRDIGLVQILYGSLTGVTEDVFQVWYQQAPGLSCCTIEEFDFFGWAVAAADFNGDRRADLAIGAPGEDLGTVADAGVVHVLYGAPGGLTATGNQLWHQRLLSNSDGIEAGDGFGSSLTAWNFGGGPQAELAIGAPGESLGSLAAAGAVSVLFGSATGLSGANQFWHQNSAGILDSAESGDRFGQALY